MGLGLVISAAVVCMAATNLANRAAPAGRGPRGPGGPVGPAGPTGPGTGGGGRGSGGPPPPPAPPPGGGTGAAISKTQCNNRSNLTLGVDNLLAMGRQWVDNRSTMGHLHTFIGLLMTRDPGGLLYIL